MPTYEYRCVNCGKVFEEYVFKLRQKYVECTDCEGTGVITDTIYPVSGHIAGSWFKPSPNDTNE